MSDPIKEKVMSALDCVEWRPLIKVFETLKASDAGARAAISFAIEDGIADGAIVQRIRSRREFRLME